jgi:hypothetical protein
VVFSVQQPPLWPAENWQAGSIWRDPHDVLLPANLPPAEYQLAVRLLTDAQDFLGVNGGDQLLLQAITTIDRPHQFEPPAWQIPLDFNFNQQVRLAGLDLPSTRVTAGGVLPLTLYWQALDTFDRNWTVFVHLTDESGQIISQQDQTPGGGQFPTTGWLPQEFLADDYSLQIPAETAPGEYRLQIGFYDVNDFSRLPVVQNGDVVGDHIRLESWPISVE